MYHEVVDEGKLKRIARDTGRSFCEVLGAWTALLSIASRSPKRGWLYVDDDTPYEIDDLAEALHMIAADAEQVLNAFRDRKMLAGCQVVKWHRRQYESDNSTARVQKHRKSKRNVPETFQCNGCETDQIQKQIQSTETDALPRSPDEHPSFLLFLDAIGADNSRGIDERYRTAFKNLHGQFGDILDAASSLALSNKFEKPAVAQRWITTTARRMKADAAKEAAEELAGKHWSELPHANPYNVPDDVPYIIDKCPEHPGKAVRLIPKDMIRMGGIQAWAAQHSDYHWNKDGFDYDRETGEWTEWPKGCSLDKS